MPEPTYRTVASFRPNLSIVEALAETGTVTYHVTEDGQPIDTRPARTFDEYRAAVAMAVALAGWGEMYVAPDEEDEEPEEDAPHYGPITVTVGVEVPMTYKDGRYQVDGIVTTTTGGLFTEAEEGVWSVEDDDWIPADDTATDKAMADAYSLVRDAVRFVR